MSQFNRKVDQSNPPKPITASKNVYNTSYNYDNRQSANSRGTMLSRPEDAQRNYQQKFKTLNRVDYLNPVARLEYEEKLGQIYTKHTAKSQQTINKKLNSKNQIAEFIDEQQNDDELFEELMDYKYGASKSKGNNNMRFHYQGSSVKKQFVFCPMCDNIHTSPPTKHTIQCDYKELSKSPLYYFESLDRIKTGLSRLMSQQSEQLCQLVEKIRRAENVNRQLQEIHQVVYDDPVLSKICEKLKQIIEQTQQ